MILDFRVVYFPTKTTRAFYHHTLPALGMWQNFYYHLPENISQCGLAINHPQSPTSANVVEKPAINIIKTTPPGVIIFQWSIPPKS